MYSLHRSSDSSERVQSNPLYVLYRRRATSSEARNKCLQHKKTGLMHDADIEPPFLLAAINELCNNHKSNKMMNPNLWNIVPSTATHDDY